MNMKLGSELSPADQKRALARYCHRFTGQLKPAWASVPMPSGQTYPVQFATDTEWLANTRFLVKADGSLKSGPCESSPTWPNNPELRKTPVV